MTVTKWRSFPAIAARSLRGLAPWALLALWFAALALVAPVNHDEDQYVAAVVLAVAKQPFVDFLYLQTPLQPLLFRALVGLVPGWDFVTLRLANAACGLGTLALVWLAQRRLGVPAPAAWVATLALAGCVSFMFSVSGARNDALPTLLLAAAAWVIADARRPLHWAVAGALIGLAASAKISFGLVGAALGLWLLVQAGRRRIDWRAPLACAAGAALGLMPTLLAFMAAPEAFVFGVLRFATEGVFDWYRQNGLDARLAQTAKLWLLPWYLMQGPALAAVLLLGWRWRHLPARAAPIQVLLIGGLIATLAPTPLWKQYLLPALPPLFILTGLVLAGLPRGHAGRARTLLLVFAAAASFGFVLSAAFDWRRSGAPAAVRMVGNAHWIGATLRAAGHVPADGRLASFTPALVIDSGFGLDPRFATGVFVFRSGDLRSDAELARFNALSWRTLDAGFARLPPLAIITGHEGISTINARRSPDATLADWARRHGYFRINHDTSRTVLWLRPPATP